MRNLFTLLLIFSTTISFAQPPSSAKPKPAAAPTQATTTSVATKTVIAYFNYDSLLVLIPGYKEAADSVKYYKVEGDKELAVMQKQLNEKRHEYDSLKLDMSPLIKALKEKEIEDISLNLKEFRLWLLQKKHTTDVYDKLITDAANKIAKANGYSAVLDSVVSDAFIMWSTPQAEFVNITKDVCTELGIK